MYVTLTQKIYVKQFRKDYGINTSPITPITQKKLLPYKRTATKSKIKKYQQKIKSLLYITVTTRPNIAFTVLRLARFLINPGPLHHKTTNKIINYLINIKNLTVYFGDSNNFEVTNNALFVNNTLDRKGSHAFIIKLFKGLISWRANKQDTVTTSTIKAELLTLLQVVKESLYISRLITKLRVQ